MCSRCDVSGAVAPATGERTRPRVPRLAPSPAAVRHSMSPARSNLLTLSADPRGRGSEHARARVLPVALAWLASFLVVSAAETNRIIRITADPNNLPFSNDKLEGFENKIADLLARELNAKI